MTRYGIDCTIPSLLDRHRSACRCAACWTWSGDSYGRSYNSANKNGRLRLQGRPFLYATFNIIPQIDPHSISQEVAKISPANLLI